MRASRVAAALPMLVAGCLRAQAPPTSTPDPRTSAIRAEITQFEALLPTFHDRGAVLFSLAADLAQTGDSKSAIARLKECIALGEGFDVDSVREFQPIEGDSAFHELAKRARRASPAVSNARTAFTVAENDLIPEGLEFDEKRRVFYLGSLNRRKIVRIALDGRFSDLLPAGRDPLLMIVGIRMDPTDETIWACTGDDDGHSELIHVDASGRLIGRHPGPPGVKHLFNDLVVRRNGDVILTDSVEGHVHRFDPRSKTFGSVPARRPLFYPNGIALASDDRSLYVADGLGVVRIDLATGKSGDVLIEGGTLAGIDGLYWNRGRLVAVQNGIGSPRIVMFTLSPDGARVTKTTVLERRTEATQLPTTGAIAGDDFYFIANSQVHNLENGKVVDPTTLAPIRISVVRLP